MMIQGTTNPVMKMMFDQARPLAPKLFTKCPYEVDFDIRNVTLENVTIPAANAIYVMRSKCYDAEKPLMEIMITLEIVNKMMG